MSDHRFHGSLAELEEATLRRIRERLLIHMSSVPVALDDFADMRAEGRYLYGDKTHQIDDMILDSSRRVFLTRPRRFGKTLLVSTLEALFQGQQEMFEGIWIHHRNWDWHAHRYPVLHLNLALAVAGRIGRRGHFQPPQSSLPLLPVPR